MKKLLLLLLFIPLVCFGQIKTAENNLKPDEKIKYYNKNWIETSKSKAKYYRTYLTNSYDSIFKIKDFNKNENFDKKSSVTEWEKNSTLDC